MVQKLQQCDKQFYQNQISSYTHKNSQQTRYNTEQTTLYNTAMVDVANKAVNKIHGLTKPGKN